MARTLATLTRSPSSCASVAEEYHRRIREDRDPVVLWDDDGPFIIDADLLAFAVEPRSTEPPEKDGG